MSYQLHTGNCLDVLRTLPDNSVDSIVTDPPYGLSFMGRKWDCDVPSVEIWAECLRVLKPGGHLLAFAGTRTQHRMCVRIEDAGFEIRDMIAWVYGSGFPKSLDVSKAIDKRGGNPGLTEKIGRAIKEARISRGLSAAECDKEFCGGTTNWSWFEGRPTGQRAPATETFSRIAKAWPELAELATAVEEVERQVVGTKTSGIANKAEGERHTIGASKSVEVDITKPATEAAQQWDGWGTALKPALEPITLARKPLIGTVAANVVEHGTGGLNIDGCRVGDDPITQHGRSDSENVAMNGRNYAEAAGRAWTGRWPANLIHDGSDEVLAAFPNAPGQMGKASTSDTQRAGQNTYGTMVRGSNGSEPRNDAGSAARFFYCAKASKRDRGEANTHPTVKPTELMRYLCRLVTPTGGVVLDPFMGSGSTGRGAVLEGFSFIGIDQDPDYTAIADARVREASLKVAA